MHLNNINGNANIIIIIIITTNNIYDNNADDATQLSEILLLRVPLSPLPLSAVFSRRSSLDFALLSQPGARNAAIVLGFAVFKALSTSVSQGCLAAAEILSQDPQTWSKCKCRPAPNAFGAQICSKCKHVPPYPCHPPPPGPDSGVRNRRCNVTRARSCSC